MRLKIVVTILFLFLACVWVSGAMASPSHHHGGKHQVASPFEKKQDTRSAHCLLNNHSHLGFCPHSLLPKDLATGPLIAADCGGKSSGAVPANFSAGKNLTLLPASWETPAFKIVENRTNVSPSYDFHLFDSLYHPPRFI